MEIEKLLKERNARSTNHMTATDLAELVITVRPKDGNLPRKQVRFNRYQNLRRLINGRSFYVEIGVIYRLCTALECTPNELFNYKSQIYE